jgi:SRSO17 transposase
MLYQSDKKNFGFYVTSIKSATKLSSHIKFYQPNFLCHRYDNTPTALEYVLGLITCEKNTANMERMEEAVDSSEYRRYQHFISHSKWDHQGILKKVQYQASEALAIQKEKNGQPTGLIIDESSHIKKGSKSVGVSRQYAGSVGKVDNCQVGVYASLCNHTSATLVHEKLYLPKSWTQDAMRCDQADIPDDQREYRTKPQLALDIIDECIENKVSFDWIGGDGLYGHSYELTKGLDERELFFVMDVHKDEKVFMEEPVIAVPESTGKRGRKPKNLKAENIAVRLDIYSKGLSKEDWEKTKIRKTAKGWLKLLVHKCKVWSWDQKEDRARERILVITKTMEKNPKIKYSFSNGEYDQYTAKEYGYFQAQRYWVERTFDDSKNELGLSDYQVRKWIGWHHHHSLVFMATLFMMTERIENGIDYPLMSVRDLRILMIVLLFGTPDDFQKRMEQMKNRHHKGQADIDRYYKNDKST